MTSRTVGDAALGWLAEFVGCVHCICLPSRMSYMTGVMQQLDTRPRYVEPIMKAEIPDSAFDDERLVLRSRMNDVDTRNLSKARIACHLSHLKALRLFLESPYATCLVFEDDITLELAVPDLRKRFEHMMQHLPSDWNYLNLGRCWSDCTHQERISDFLVSSPVMFCRHAYLVNRDGADVIGRHALPMAKAGGDVIYTDLIQTGMLTGYAVTPRLFGQNRALGSTLGNVDEGKECAN